MSLIWVPRTSDNRAAASAAAPLAWVTVSGMIFINPAACLGCGNCASACPRKLIQVQHQTDDQIIAKEMAIFDWLAA
jgi:heterodisulfide reductase subunit A-like polyferredoxin